MMRRSEPRAAAQALVTDTVGFIAHLSHSLVDCFLATLEEV